MTEDDPALTAAMRDFVTSRDPAYHAKLLTGLFAAVATASTDKSGAVILMNGEIIAALIDALILYSAGSRACATEAWRLEFASVVGYEILAGLAPARATIEEFGIENLREGEA